MTIYCNTGNPEIFDRVAVVKHPDGHNTLRYPAATAEQNNKVVEVSDDVRNPMWQRDCPVCKRPLTKPHHGNPVICECGGFIWR